MKEMYHSKQCEKCIFMACAEQSWWLHGVWVAETFLFVLSAREPSLLFFVFYPIISISLR